MTKENILKGMRNQEANTNSIWCTGY